MKSCDLQIFHGPVPNIKERNLMGYFSTNEEGNYELGTSQLKYYKRPEKAHFNLNKEITAEDFEEKKECKLDPLLKWISDNIEKVFSKTPDGRWSSPDFVCYRGLLANFMKIFIDHCDDYFFCASKFEGTIYLCLYDTLEKKNQGPTRPNQLHCLWHYKFEQCVLRDDPKKIPNPSIPINIEAGFHCVYKSKYSNHELLYSGEIDGIESTKKVEDLFDENIEFVELKTSIVVPNRKHYDTLDRNEFMRWWCQSYLDGINNIACGFYDDDGIVQEVREYEIEEIVEEFWNTDGCKRTCASVLNQIKKYVKKDYDKCLYKFTRNRYRQFSLDVHELDPLNEELSFLPEWYINKVKSYKRTLTDFDF